MKPFNLIPLKYQEFGEEEVEFKKQKILFKSVKNISVLNVAFSKSVRVLIKNGCTSSNWDSNAYFGKKIKQSFHIKNF